MNLYLISNKLCGHHILRLGYVDLLYFVSFVKTHFSRLGISKLGLKCFPLFVFTIQSALSLHNIKSSVFHHEIILSKLRSLRTFLNSAYNKTSVFFVQRKWPFNVPLNAH